MNELDQKLLQKDKRELTADPLKRLNKSQTKRLEEAFFAEMKAQEEESLIAWEEEETEQYY